MELKLGLKDRKLINNLPKFEGGKTFWENPYVGNTTSPQLSKLLVLPIQNQGWSYSTAAKVNTNNFKLNNPMNTSGKGGVLADASDALAAAGAGPGWAIGAWLGGGAVEGANSILKPGQLMALAGTSDASFDGIGYTKHNAVGDDVMRQYNRLKNLAWAVNPAKALVMNIWGDDAQAKAIQLANEISSSVNDFAMASAGTQALLLRNKKKDGDFSQLVLYGAKDGKLPRFVNGFDGRARISNGEVYGHINPISGEVTDAHVAGHGHDKKDSLIRDLGGTEAEFNRSFVLPEEYAKLVRNGMDVNVAVDMFSKGLSPKSFKCGKMPRFKNGWYNYIPYGINTAMGLGLLDYFMRLKPRSMSIYAENPYEKSALNDLAGLRINQYPIINKFTQANAEANYAIDNSGGLGGGQRARLRSANLSTTLRNIADMLMNIQHQNNEYTSQLAGAKMNLGAQRAQRMQQSNQFNKTSYLQQNSAYNKNLMTSLANISNMIGQGYKAYNTDRLNDKLINMWHLDLNDKQLALLQRIRKGETV